MVCDRWYTDRLARQKLKFEKSRIERLKQRIQQREAELRDATQDLEKQRSISLAIRAELDELSLVTQRLVEIEREVQRNSEEERQQLRNQLGAAGADISGLERELEEHVREVTQNLIDERNLISRSLEEARKNLDDTNARILAATKAVEDKLVADRELLLQRDTNDISRAETQIELVFDLLSNELDLNSLELQQQRDKIIGNLKNAKRYCQSGDGQAALSCSNEAADQYRAVQREAQRRRAALASARRNILTRIEQIAAYFQTSNLEKCFSLETRQLKSDLTELKQQFDKGYPSYNAIDTQTSKATRDLAAIEQEVQEMISRIGIVLELATQRSHRAREVDRLLQKQLGVPIERTARLEIDDDIKSKLIVDYGFGTRKLSVGFSLTGPIGIVADDGSWPQLQTQLVSIPLKEREQLAETYRTTGQTTPHRLVVEPPDVLVRRSLP